ncbi:hypothetical protein THIOKS11730007 [Thiocapsa sp. KS1]|nr:hypothetical protein THIOKS11730007 [Thiocapsa sp. KS1]
MAYAGPVRVELCVLGGHRLGLPAHEPERSRDGFAFPKSPTSREYHFPCQVMNCGIAGCRAS